MSSAARNIPGTNSTNRALLSNTFLSPMPQAQAPESVATYAADCTTPQTHFEVGDTACAKAEGTLFGFYRIHWVNSQGEAVQTDIVSSTNRTSSWVVTASGNWKAYLSDADSSLRSAAFFSGSDPAAAAVDLSVSDTVLSTSSLVADGIVSYEVWVLNNGPDAAENVSLVQTIPNNVTRETQISVQDSGPSFDCTDNVTDTTCTISSLASGASAYFTFIYKLNSGVAVGTAISNTASISSDTSELHAPDNSAATDFDVVAGTPAANCVLDCPSNITKVADSGQNGAFVTFSSAEGIGSCGDINSSTPSGSFFPLGATTVTVTSSEGGGGCSFTVTVVTEGAPTISCPEDQIVQAQTGETSATVDPGTPTTTPASGVSVSGVRSDNEALNDPYPVGTTFITWTATSTSNGLTSTCSQKIVVNADGCGTDTEDPTITAPDDVTLETPTNTVGSCGFVVGESELGTANAADNCTFNVVRSGVPAGNFFPVGSTTVTYTVTDAAGNSASDTQVVTVADKSLPRIEAPADASYTCQSEVPAANPSQATRGVVLDENGNPLPPGPPSDNCGTPTVTVSESSSGAGSSSSPLVITRTFTATDAAGNSASDDQVITVIDPTPPTITAPADASFQCASSVPAANAGDATAADNCAAPTVTVSDSSNNGAGSAASPLVITRTFTATDAAGNTASDSQTITVIDNTAPTVSAPADASYQCASGVPAGGAGDATASDNCGTASIAYSESNNGGSGTAASPLIITRTYTATDAVGNSASDSQTITVIDNTPPVISCPANIVVYLPLNSSATSMPVTYPAPTATDNCSSPSVTTDIASGSTFSVGTTTVTATANDGKGNSSTCQFTVTVLYNFTGFFAPVDNLPAFNEMNAGRAVPVKFSLSGNKGLAIFAANSPNSQQISCTSSDPVADVEETSTAGSSSLTYDTSSGRYHYVWKTESSWKNTCRQLNVVLNDGSTHSAKFKFK